ncbi:unnamed protein product, partial [Laminaria digitata]
ASPIVAFYRDGGRSISDEGGAGPSLVEVLQQSDGWLEDTHDYIQWVFPTMESSTHNRIAPVVTYADIVEVNRHGEHVRGKMLWVLARMLRLYRLKMVVKHGDELRVETGDGFTPDAKLMEPSDHNSLRLTRIIASLRLFRLEEHANALQAFLCGLSEVKDHPSQTYWGSA